VKALALLSAMGAESMRVTFTFFYFSSHCINAVLLSMKSSVYALRDSEHHFELPT